MASEASTNLKGDTADEAAGAAGQKTTIRLLVVLNNRKTLAGAFQFLERRGYQILVAHHIPDAVSQLVTLKPHALLISWNLLNTDVRKTYKVLTEKFNLLSIVFAEDNNTRTTTSLMGSGIPHSLLAPVSGPSIHMRVQALLRNRRDMGKDGKKRVVPQYYDGQDGDGGKIRIKNLEEDSRILVKMDEIPPEVQWQKVASSRNSGVSHWEGNAPLTAKGKQKVFYFKGPAAPTWDPEKKSWKFDHDSPPPVYVEKRARTDKRAPVFTEERFQGKDYSAVEESANGENFSAIEEHPEGEIKSATQEGLEAGEEMSTEAEVFNPWDEINAQATEKELAQFAQELARELEADGASYEFETAAGEKKNTNYEEGELRDPKNAEFEDGEPFPPEFKDSTTEEDPSLSREPVPEDSPAPKNNQGAASGYGIGENQNREARHFGQLNSLIYQCAQPAFESSVNPPGLDIRALNEINETTFALVHTDRFTGYFLMASANGNPLKEFTKLFLEKFWQAMGAQGETVRTPSEPVEFKTASFPFVAWAKEKAEFLVTIPHGDDTLALAYVKMEGLPHFEAIPEKKILGVSLASFSGGLRLLFDVFLHLPKNGKFLLYANRGTVLPVKTVTKFTGFGIKDLSSAIQNVIPSWHTARLRSSNPPESAEVFSQPVENKRPLNFLSSATATEFFFNRA